MRTKVHRAVVFPSETTPLGPEGLLTAGADGEARGTPCARDCRVRTQKY